MFEPLRLFLVEDDDNIAFLMRRYLERAGHEVQHCRSAADALLVLGQEQFDLVLLDNKLPDMPGLELLKTLNHEGISTPVLFITGYGDQLLATEVLRAGALDYVVKDNDKHFLPELPKRVRESVVRHRLQRTNGLLIAALESARDGVVVTDLKGVVSHVNRAFEEMLGYRRDEVLERQCPIFLAEDSTSLDFEDLRRKAASHGGWQGEISVRRKDATLVDASLTLSPIFDERCQLTHFVAILRDMGDQKKMERQLYQAQKMQSVGTLAGGVAHEFNNLLAGVQGYASLALRDPALSDQTREFMDNVVQLSDRAAHLTRQLLAFARKPALSRAPIQVDSLLKSTRDFVQKTLNVQVEIDVGPAFAKNPSWNLVIDGNQIQQVLVNLALNARDAQPKNAPSPIIFHLRHLTLVADLPAFPQDVPIGEYVVLEVEDHGLGMSADVLRQSVDPFFTTKDVGQGTGLGLSVAFGIMNGHSGFMTLESERGVGTRVGLFFPMDASPPPPQAMLSDAPVPEVRLVPSRRILVVDDEAAVQDVVRRFLDIAGHQVQCVSSGQRAVEILTRGEDFDLVILDLMIPKEEGVANYRRIRGLRPKIPLLICTGLVQDDQASQLLGEGATEVLRKPFRMNDLWLAVNRCTGERGASAP